MGGEKFEVTERNNSTFRKWNGKYKLNIEWNKKIENKLNKIKWKIEIE